MHKHLTTHDTYHISSSQHLSKGSKLNRTVEENMTGSCGMMPTRDRSVVSGTVLMSNPSIVILPPDSSCMRNRAFMREDLPNN